MKLILIVLMPLMAFCSELTNFYADNFIKSFHDGCFTQSLSILDQWECLDPEHKTKIKGMKAAVCLSVGDLNKGTALMEEFIGELSYVDLQDPMICFALDMYFKGFCEPDDKPYAIGISNNPYEQPSGVKLKYWFGIGQVIVGVLAAPFSAGMSGALILSGTAMVVDAASDAMNNRETIQRRIEDKKTTI